MDSREMISLENELLSLKKVKLRSNHLLLDQELEFVKNNYNSLQLDSIERNICDLIIKIESLKIQIHQFINNYWISILNS